MLLRHLVSLISDIEVRLVVNEEIGTGTFGRVLLVRLRPAANQPGAVQHFAMKVLKKSEVVRLKQVEHVNSERNILSRIRHPFIVDL